MRSFATFLLTLLVALTATAQVVQPSYVRQSKSAQIQVFTAAQTSTTAVPRVFDSSVIETTSFNSSQLFIDFDFFCSGIVRVLSGLNKNGPFVETASATPNGYKDIDTILNSPTIYNVTNFGPYIKVQFSTPNCPNGLNLSATLIPFPSNVTVQGDTSNASFPVQIGGKFVTSGGITALSASPSGGDLYVRPRAVGASGFLPTSPVSISSSMRGAWTAPSRARRRGSCCRRGSAFSTSARRDLPSSMWN